MRILRVAQDIFPETVGGAPYHIHALSRDQAARGHDVTVLTVSGEVDQRETVERDGYTLIRQPPKAEILGNQLFTNTIGTLRNNADYDVVHAHSHLFFSSNVAAAYCRLGDVPLAVTCHGLNSQRGPFWFSRAHLRTLGKWTYDSADVTFCYTDIERSKLRDLGVDADIAVVNNGIDTDRFSPSGPKHERIDAAPGPAITFVGRLVDGKRPQDVLAAFAEIRDRCPDAQLFFCGDGPMRDSLENTVTERGLHDAVTFLGRVPYSEMPTVFRAADLFVLPSRTEGFPRTVLEALSCETPVVASNLEQTATIVEQTGATVEVGDIEGLATAVADLVEDEQLLSDLGSHGRRIVTTRYDWADTVRETTNVLGQVAEISEPATTERKGPSSPQIPVARDEMGSK
ncbi:glycosyltransferase family 4 protein [Haloarcula sp. S1AR25-5A]|uniref:Glycosyltransferase family 4 protein n=1 Tax=Haloarcula terrestris TaxID=2950533 RepID=A0AAE4F0P1_9EURY|nr:glycosyltransferase family 4 protein [Haloarcula terrestris]MDS0222834.1 glycosyltransferase family 4 protein [Haloarcula terrestris]